MSAEMLEIIKKRRSIRKFREEEVSDKNLDEILKAGLFAPSSKNKKPVEFIVVKGMQEYGNHWPCYGSCCHCRDC